jgi:hypothetical protein
MASRRHSSDTKWQTLGGNIISIQDNCVFMQIAILQCLAVVNTHTQIYRHYQSHHYFKKITHSCHHLPNNSRYFKKTTPLLWNIINHTIILRKSHTHAITYPIIPVILRKPHHYYGSKRSLYTCTYIHLVHHHSDTPLLSLAQFRVISAHQGTSSFMLPGTVKNSVPSSSLSY